METLGDVPSPKNTRLKRKTLYEKEQFQKQQHKDRKVNYVLIFRSFLMI